MLVDLAHANIETSEAALNVTTKPVIISHTGLDSQLGQNAAMARMMRPRLISREQAKTVADAGGVIGVWTHLAASPLEYAQNLRTLVDVIGVDHVCIGTDTKLTRPYRTGGNSQPGAGPGGNGKASPGSNRPGGPGGATRVGERTNEAWEGETVGFYYAVVAAMLKAGFSADEIGKIGGGNFCRVFGAATEVRG